MMRRSFNTALRSGMARVATTLAMVCALVIGVVQDTGHSHDSGDDVSSCDTCYFTPDPGCAAAHDASRTLAARTRNISDPPACAPCSAPESAYDARGPPLLI